MKEIKSHPFAELFPFMPAPEMNELVKDIRLRGLQHPIILFEGKILDGRHRYEACQIAEVSPKFEQYKGDDALGFVIASNLKRRHLSDAQRAMIAAKLANMEQGQKKSDKLKPANVPVSQSEAAQTLGISERSVRTAKSILDESPKLTKQVDSGKISLAAASKKLAESKVNGEPVRDETGWLIPDEMIPLWQRRGEVREMLAQISNVENRLLQFQKDKDELFAPVNFSSAVAKLQFAHMEIKAAQLYAVCTTCQGRARKKCAHCKGSGFLSHSSYKLVPSELRAIREKAAKK